MIKNEQLMIVSQKQIAESIYELTLQGELVSEMKQPGQFVHLKTGDGYEPLLRRPISISSIDNEKKQFTMIYRAEGRGTALLSAKKEKQKVDVLGPLGNGFPVEAAAEGETALLIGGGIGVPPLFELSRKLTEKGVRVIHVLGFQTKNAMFYEQQFSLLGETHIATVDGSYGTKGLVTDVIDNLRDNFAAIYSCGPTPMLKAVQDKFQGRDVFLSLEERMGCGIGACFACVCHAAEGAGGKSYRKVCSDGPVFPAGEVVL
ncbi:dihydroorotate dehydrogenase electron transfer subunit [Peribacillus saganii]|uniref:Dihydroorotate dehydrogenase B (NAD(+)), electron transfer subunit n=1 Tax=Peribacillus saganii TaxID=2303992 RepID=A0A372LBH4_9BACI|nr:dihydroorotate dehydrogenase electron transfer subunit [Peribacillus saganii]RFU63207.1 dihydroorotate dehydrogenase electron transfer subunit [Peribacillus saganii]